MNIFEICDPSNPWDRRSLALWHEAQARHGGRIKLKAKLKSKDLFLRVSWIVAFIAALFGAVSAIFSREKKILEGWRDSWKQTPSLLQGEFTTFSYTIYVPGDGHLFYILPPDKRFEVLWHQISHIDFLYLGTPLATEMIHPPPERSAFIQWYDRYIGCHIVRLMWIFWRWPFGHATFRQEFEAAGFLCEVRVEIMTRDGSPSDVRRQLLAELFGGPTYGYMATRKEARRIANSIVDQAANEWRNGWIQDRLMSLEDRFYQYHPSGIIQQ